MTTCIANNTTYLGSYLKLEDLARLRGSLFNPSAHNDLSISTQTRIIPSPLVLLSHFPLDALALAPSSKLLPYRLQNLYICRGWPQPDIAAEELTNLKKIFEGLSTHLFPGCDNSHYHYDQHHCSFSES